MQEIFQKYKSKLNATSKEKSSIWEKIESEITPRSRLQLKPFILGLSLFLIFFSSAIYLVHNYDRRTQKDDITTAELIDDWQYSQGESDDQSAKSTSFSTLEGDSSLGYTPGGSNDINNFRANIYYEYLPIPSDLTYEGILSEYYFKKESGEECKDLLCPYHSHAISKDPQSGEDVYYLGIGFNSNINEEDFQRKKLNLVVVLDISGSMSSSFDEYHYDNSDSSESESKMQIAAESVNALLDHLNPDDRFGMVLFNNSAYSAKPLNKVEETDIEAIKRHILEINANGGTNIEAGLSEATELFQNHLEENEEYENRIIFLTDAMPNTGDTTVPRFLEIIRDNASNKIYTTAIGIGVDFQTELIVDIMNEPGTNYYSVHSSEDFRARLDDNFEYMVSPIIFDLDFEFHSNTFKIDGIYGSPTSDIHNNKVMEIKTLFPSETSGDESKGSIILMQLSKINTESTTWDIEFELNYKDRNDNSYQNEIKIDDLLRNEEFYDNLSIRKAILFSRYVNLLYNWMYNEWVDTPEYPIFDCTDTILPPGIPGGEHYWERQSKPLSVSDNYKEIFESFLSHFSQESDIIGDENLKRESDLLEFLIEWE